MTVQSFATTVRAEVNTTPQPVGDRDQRFTPDETVTFHAVADSGTLPKHYLHHGDTWIELCGRCDGKGNVGYGPFDGICFGCNGVGANVGTRCNRAELEMRLGTWGRRAATKAAKQKAARAAHDIERQAWRTANAALVAWADALTPSGFAEEVDTYQKRAATRAEAEAPEVASDRLMKCEKTDEGWWALFAVDIPKFLQFGPKADGHILAVRNGLMLDARTTAYLTKIMEAAPARAAAQTARSEASRHAAAPKTRMAIQGTVVFIKELDNDFGPTRLVVVEGTGVDAGITWNTFSSAETVWGLEKGDAVHVKATIKNNEVYEGVKRDIVQRPVFTVVDGGTPAPAPQPAPPAPAAPVTPAPAPATPEASPSATVKAPAAPGGTRRRAAQGASSVEGWELLYDKPRQDAQVVRNDSGYGLACTRHLTVTPLARLTDERGLRAAGGWCCR